jgi:hypothetical protein
MSTRSTRIIINNKVKDISISKQDKLLRSKPAIDNPYRNKRNIFIEYTGTPATVPSNTDHDRQSLYRGSTGNLTPKGPIPVKKETYTVSSFCV